MSQSQSPIPTIGIFDSGVGGLSVLQAILELIPAQGIVYLADQAHVPYGPRSLEQVRNFSVEITRYLIGIGVKLVVVACNTASAAALYSLRAAFPEIPFVGMEPALKPAAEHTQSKIVGVLATPATFQGALYASVVERFATNVIIHTHTCPGLVEKIEAGNLDGTDTRQILEEALIPMISKGVDTIVLGCTHYPFVIPLIQHIVGPQIRVIDPAPAVARQVSRVLNQNSPMVIESSDLTRLKQTSYITTGDPIRFHYQLEQLLKASSNVEQLTWDEQAGKLFFVKSG